MKIKAVRSLLWVMNVFFLLGLGALSYYAIKSKDDVPPIRNATQIQEEKLVPLRDEFRKQEQSSQADAVGPETHASLYTTVIDGTIQVEQKPIEQKPVEKEPPKPKIRPISEFLKLAAVYVDEGRPELSSASIQLNQPPPGKPNSSWKLLSVGDELELQQGNPKAVLKEVHEFKIVFEYDPENEENNVVEMTRRSPFDVSQLGGSPAKPILGGSRNPALEAARNLRRGGRGPDDAAPEVEGPEESYFDENNNIWHIASSESEQISQNYEQMLGELQLQEYRDPRTNQVAGLQVHSVPDGSLAAQRGLQGSDVLKRVDNRKITNQASLISYIRSQKNRSVFTITLQRNGRDVTMRFRTYPQR